ncbi:MAG: peptidoglycan-binding protein [Candidatus Pacebacteria bacterium]|nr:peptidoglycan-binding protein [Candidatus Paceibacterota bacterium]
MIHKILIGTFFLVLFGFSGGQATAQLLSFDTDSSASKITVGTTTYDVSFPKATLQSAQSRLRDILYYLRTFDSVAIPDTIFSEVSTTTSTNVYSDIANFAFEENAENNASKNITNFAQSQKCYIFGGNFDLGVRGEEVIEIQRFLNTFPETRVAETGPGSPGEETDYFGSRTFAAVFAFQSLHSDVILAPLGLLNPTGFWGAATRTYANTLAGCSDDE